ncbi:cyclin-dependent kinase 4 inhibitor D [Triplophysa rosa]|uniref:Cyclin-dependent kinase 4 inhibitor D n=1 Tax=Triplophysa rosa TaxID=992332 RepID=A0A9W7WT17_TRIRA|nr:cyclin-dependent kinase 4 inhibitor D [Triplophysa rosa]XP_057194392.1 cyclin-dependent kinase 4 inhibitor D [Triplophysa rosa]KAI7807725.1 putative cyclin-dependent kinase 4 inhibitor D [Triplophysa rosa]
MVLDGFGCGKSLSAAAAQGNVVAVRRILQDRRVEPDTLNEFGKTALQVMMMGCTSVARVLLEHGADPNVQDRCGVTPAHDAARTGFLDTLRALVEHGASVNIPDHSGSIPIHIAIREGHWDVVEYLAPLSNLSHRDSRGANALDVARAARAPEMVEVLEPMMN